MATFLLRKIDDDLWRRFKGRLALEGVTAQALVSQLIQEYAEGGPEILGPGRPVDDDTIDHDPDAQAQE